MDELEEFAEELAPKTMQEWALGCYLIALIDWFNDADSFSDGELDDLLDNAEGFLVDWKAKYMEEIIALEDHKT